MRSILSLSLVLCAAWVRPGEGRAAVFSVVVDRMNADYEKVLAAVQRQAGGSHTVLVFETFKTNLADPIKRGRFLSKVAVGELVIPIGNRATELVSDELEGVPIFFIGASRVSGSTLSSKRVSGILSYSPAGLIRLVRRIVPEATQIGVVYTAGYSAIVSDMAAEADRQRISLIKAVVREKKEIGPAFREVVAKSGVVWLSGDPLLVKGAAFDFAMSESLIRRRPVIGSSIEEVEKGALFCPVPDYDHLSGLAENALKELLQASPPLTGKRIEASLAVGGVAMNAHIARKLKITAPADLKVTWIE